MLFQKKPYVKKITYFGDKEFTVVLTESHLEFIDFTSNIIVDKILSSLSKWYLWRDRN